MPKKHVENPLLSKNIPAPPAAPSSAAGLPEQEEQGAQSHHRTSAISHRAGLMRVNRGYKLREDLIKSCKRLALETDRPLYEVMEEALEEYLARHA